MPKYKYFEHDFFLANLFIQQITIQESIYARKQMRIIMNVLYAIITRAYPVHAKVSFCINGM